MSRKWLVVGFKQVSSELWSPRLRSCVCPSTQTPTSPLSAFLPLYRMSCYVIFSKYFDQMSISDKLGNRLMFVDAEFSHRLVEQLCVACFLFPKLSVTAVQNIFCVTFAQFLWPDHFFLAVLVLQPIQGCTCILSPWPQLQLDLVRTGYIMWQEGHCVFPAVSCCHSSGRW